MVRTTSAQLVGLRDVEMSGVQEDGKPMTDPNMALPTSARRGDTVSKLRLILLGVALMVIALTSSASYRRTYPIIACDFEDMFPTVAGQSVQQW